MQTTAAAPGSAAGQREDAKRLFRSPPPPAFHHTPSAQRACGLRQPQGLSRALCEAPTPHGRTPGAPLVPAARPPHRAAPSHVRRGGPCILSREIFSIPENSEAPAPGRSATSRDTAKGSDGGEAAAWSQAMRLQGHSGASEASQARPGVARRGKERRGPRRGPSREHRPGARRSTLTSFCMENKGGEDEREGGRGRRSEEGGARGGDTGRHTASAPPRPARAHRATPRCRLIEFAAPTI